MCVTKLQKYTYELLKEKKNVNARVSNCVLLKFKNSC